VNCSFKASASLTDQGREHQIAYLDIDACLAHVWD